MSISRLNVLKQAIEPLGGKVGNVASGTAYSAVLTGLVDTLGDDAELVGSLLIFPEAATAADQERVIDEWDDENGTATWSLARSDTTYTNETYIVVPRIGQTYTLTDMRNALNEALRRGKRTYDLMIPITPGQPEYLQTTATWLRSADDIDSVQVSDSPSFAFNEDFKLWRAGTSSAPDGWTLSGSGATIAQNSTYMLSGYAAAVTRVGADCTLLQSVPVGFARYLASGPGSPQTVSMGAWVVATAASRARLSMNDGVTTTYSTYHTGGSGFEWLTVSKTLSASATGLSFGLSIDSGNTTAYIARCCPVVGSSVVDTLKDYGSAAFKPYPAESQRKNIGTVPNVTLVQHHDYATFRQLHVFSRRNYPELSADSDATDCPDEMAVSGLVYFLTSKRKPGQDRTRLDAIRAEYGREWMVLDESVSAVPIPAQPRTVRVGGV